MAKSKDPQQSRSYATQQALMLAAEKLIAKKGIKNVSIKEIVKVAGQKNESALQYHFKSLQGLINTIKEKRSEQTQAMRAQLIAELQNSGQPITLRDLCKMMVLPTFLLARKSADFRRFIISFSHELALQGNALVHVQKTGGGGESGRLLSELLISQLTHLDDTERPHRMEAAIRLVSISIGHHARQKSAFQGVESDYFLSHLIDVVEGILSSPISQETHRLKEQLQN